MRPRGTGSIERERSGHHRARISTDAGRRSLGTYGTAEEAAAILDAARAELGKLDHARDGITLSQWAARVLDRRERDGYRGTPAERNRWAVHLERAEIGALPVRSIVRGDVLRWLDIMQAKRAADRRGTRRLSRTTISNALNLLRAVLQDANDRHLLTANPARDVRLPRSSRARSDEPWTYLEPDEQAALLDAIPGDEDRDLVAFALWTGLRQGEQWALQIGDVITDGPRPHVVVRFGGPNAPTKNGKIRSVPLFGEALEAARRQKARRRGGRVSANDASASKRLLWPAPSGSARQKGAPDAWAAWTSVLGRSVRWHDLRHTCASALIAGWYGRTWTLREVQALLGHGSITTTERYAHLAGTILDQAGAETRAASARALPAPVGFPRGKSDATARDDSGSHLRGLNSRPTVYETERIAKGSRDVAHLDARARALEALRLAAARDPMAWPAMVAALEGCAAVLEAPNARSAAG